MAVITTIEGFNKEFKAGDFITFGGESHHNATVICVLPEKMVFSERKVSFCAPVALIKVYKTWAVATDVQLFYEEAPGWQDKVNECALADEEETEMLKKAIADIKAKAQEVEEKLKAAAMNYLSKRDGNFYAEEGKVPVLKIFGEDVEVETIWYNKDEDKIYLHCGCREFEGDIDINSLSTENQQTLLNTLQKYI